MGIHFKWQIEKQKKNGLNHFAENQFESVYNLESVFLL